MIDEYEFLKVLGFGADGLGSTASPSRILPMKAFEINQKRIRKNIAQSSSPYQYPARRRRTGRTTQLVYDIFKECNQRKIVYVYSTNNSMNAYINKMVNRIIANKEFFSQQKVMPRKNINLFFRNTSVNTKSHDNMLSGEMRGAMKSDIVLIDNSVGELNYDTDYPSDIAEILNQIEKNNPSAEIKTYE